MAETASDISVEDLVTALEAQQRLLSLEDIRRLSAIVKAQVEVVDESCFTRFKAQYDALPQSNKLAQNSTWEDVLVKLSKPKNADKFCKVREELQGGGRLYAVLEDGSVEFVDDNTDTPPMFLKDKEQFARDHTLQIIYKRDTDQMQTAFTQINKGDAEWASIQEMLDWAEANDFGVFVGHPWGAGKLMKMAAAVSPTGQFVGGYKGFWIATVLKDGLTASLSKAPTARCHIGDTQKLEFRHSNLGLIRRLRFV